MSLVMTKAKKGKLLFVVTEEWYFRSHRMDLALAALSAGYNVYVACRTSSGIDLIDQGIRFHSIGWSRSDGMIKVLKSIAELHRLISRLQPDIVHNVSLKPILLGSAAAVTSKAKIVNAVTGLGLAFSSRRLIYRLFALIIVAYLSILNVLKRPYFIFQNKDDRIRLDLLGALTPDRIEIIRGSGVNTEAYSFSAEPDGDTVCVSVVCRMLYLKGVEDLVKASDILVSRGISHLLLLIGAPDPENPSSIDEGTLRSWNESHQVSWQGHCEDVYSSLAKSHFSALASHGGEGLPKSLLEAAAVGRPLVATDVPGNREIVCPGVNGILVPPHSPSELADALEQLIKDPMLREVYGRESRKLVESEFSSAIITTQTLNLYERVMQHR